MFQTGHEFYPWLTLLLETLVMETAIFFFRNNLHMLDYCIY